MGNGPKIGLLNMRRWSQKWKFELGGVRGVSNWFLVTLDWQLMVLPLTCAKHIENQEKKRKRLIGDVKHKIS